MSGMRGYAEMSYEDLLREGIVVAGSPDSVGEQIERLRDELGFGAMNVLMCIGDMPHDRVVKSMELFAGQVMPAFRESQPPASEPAPAPPQ
jgi:alkanesulfonate monooxygenase SsuD/methylene tetrahydromethanopterin reductase-like flavin-dependent oxidoreductase (luciferase family)